MVKTKTKVKICFVAALSVAAGFSASKLVPQEVKAEESENMTFNVNVVESLSVTITTPTEWASGNINTLLRNKVNLEVSSNNPNGFTTSMYTPNTNAALLHDSGEAADNKTIPTLGATTTRAAFPLNSWGYSTDDTDAGSDSSNYNAMVNTSAAPITLSDLTSASAATKEHAVYFGAKADSTKAAGVYNGNVVVSVVAGEVTSTEDDPNDNPITPSNPATPGDDTNQTDNTATYNSTANRSVYTRTTRGSASGSTSGSTSGTTPSTTGVGYNTPDNTTTSVDTTETTVMSGEHTAPLGVTESKELGETTSNIVSNSPLAVGLAVGAGVAATSGLVFFALAKRDDDDDEEETA